MKGNTAHRALFIHSKMFEHFFPRQNEDQTAVDPQDHAAAPVNEVQPVKENEAPLDKESDGRFELDSE